MIDEKSILSAWRSEIRDDLDTAESALEAARAELTEAKWADDLERARIEAVNDIERAVAGPKNAIAAELAWRFRDLARPRNPGAYLAARAAVEGAENRVVALFEALTQLDAFLTPIIQPVEIPPVIEPPAEIFNPIVMPAAVSRLKVA